MPDELHSESLLAMFAAGGLTATLVFEGPADRCPECSPPLAHAA